MIQRYAIIYRSGLRPLLKVQLPDERCGSCQGRAHQRANWLRLRGARSWVPKWRMGRDSNPRYLSVHTLSRRARSTALAPIRNEPTSLLSIAGACNPFVTAGALSCLRRRCHGYCQVPATISRRRLLAELERGIQRPFDSSKTMSRPPKPVTSNNKSVTYVLSLKCYPCSEPSLPITSHS
jgi:hypothetical protein